MRTGTPSNALGRKIAWLAIPLLVLVSLLAIQPWGKLTEVNQPSTLQFDHEAASLAEGFLNSRPDYEHGNHPPLTAVSLPTAGFEHLPASGDARSNTAAADSPRVRMIASPRVRMIALRNAPSADVALAHDDGPRVYSFTQLEPIGGPSAAKSAGSETLPAPNKIEQLNFPEANQPHPGDWWRKVVQSPQQAGADHVLISLDSIIPAALQHSNLIQISRLEPFIEQEKVTQVDSRFDWSVFTRNLWTGINKPAGSSLDAGVNISRQISQDMAMENGLKKVNVLGGEFTAFQNMRLYNSNSEYLTPNRQGLTEFTIRYSQPLLKNGGYLVNYGQVILAQQQTAASFARTEAQINILLRNVIEAYWGVYLARVDYVIQVNLIEQTTNLLTILDKRQKIDADSSLIAQVKERLWKQKADLENIRIQLRVAQNQLARIVGDRNLDRYGEFVTTDAPASEPFELNEENFFKVALQQRSELRAAVAQIKSSELVKKISEKQLLPTLALFLQTNANGLNGNYDIGRSLGDQFADGTPSLIAGLNFEYQLGNRSARSRLRQAQNQLMQDTARFENTVDFIKQDVRDSCARIDGNMRQMNLRRQAIEDSWRSLISLQRRRIIFPDESERITQLFVREVLDAQERLASEEKNLINTYVQYSIAIIYLRQATGTLFSQTELSCQLLGSEQSEQPKAPPNQELPYSNIDLNPQNPVQP